MPAEFLVFFFKFRFDDFLEGRADAISSEEKEGLDLFVSVGCVACHNGAGLGGGMYQKLGVTKPYPTKDTGRHQVTKKDTDKFFFKVPSLRNINQTAPYFHDGGVETLETAVNRMSVFQLGRVLSKEETDKIVAFLKSLDGDLSPEVVAILEPEFRRKNLVRAKFGARPQTQE